MLGLIAALIVVNGLVMVCYALKIAKLCILRVVYGSKHEKRRAKRALLTKEVRVVLKNFEDKTENNL